MVQWVASGIGGYLTGRLRIRWHETTPQHEVFFRDTAHGLLSWAVSSVIVAGVLASVAGGAAHTAVMAAGPDRDMQGPRGGIEKLAAMDIDGVTAPGPARDRRVG